MKRLSEAKSAAPNPRIDRSSKRADIPLNGKEHLYKTAIMKMDMAFVDASPLLSIRGLTVEFRISKGVLRAVDDVDLDIFEGEILGLAGESGCGKSVLAHSIIRQTDPNGYFKTGKVVFRDKGDVMTFSDDELRKFRWKDVAIVFQGAQSSFNPVMRVGEHFVDTVLAHERRSKDQIFKRSAELLDMVRLDSNQLSSMFPHEISGGMKQRTIVSLGLLLKPELLILDEPTSSLDVLTQKYFMNSIRDLHEKTGITMFYITHDLATIAEVADRVAIMYLGSIIEVGGVEDIFYEPKHPYTKALLKSIPSLVGAIGDVKPIPPPIPDPVNPPSGCKFHPRCPFAFDVCSRDRPEPTDMGGGRLVACHLYSRVRQKKVAEND